MSASVSMFFVAQLLPGIGQALAKHFFRCRKIPFGLPVSAPDRPVAMASTPEASALWRPFADHEPSSSADHHDQHQHKHRRPATLPQSGPTDFFI